MTIAIRRAPPRRVSRRGGGGLVVACGLLLFAACSYDVTLGSIAHYTLAVMSCGTWDSADGHTTGEYFIGHSILRPNETMSYFVFDLTPIQGRTLVAVSLTLPGTSDWKITVPADTETPPLQFKVGVTPPPPGTTLSQVIDGSSNVYPAVQAEQDLGFAWVPSGATTNSYDAFHYHNDRIQRAVDAGGLYPLFTLQRFDPGATTTSEQYLYGGATCGAAIVLNVAVE